MRKPIGTECVVMLALLATASSCVFRGVRRDIRVMQQSSSVRGTVARERARLGDILVVAYTPGSSVATDVFTLQEPGEYLFTLRAGDYRIVAFEDRNGDRALDPTGEIHSDVVDLRLAAGENRPSVDLRLTPDARVPPDMPRLPEPGQRPDDGLPDIDVGVLTTLDDPRFSSDNGSLGMWQPVKFMFDVGAGIYFLEPCDPSRTPILFVHGIGGSPAEFKYLVGSLDRHRFQPWFAYYPSGFELGRIADGLLRWVQEIQTQCRFHRLVVVAHSMGGLVARAFIQRAAAGAVPVIAGIDTFVSISTPWGGHPAAGRGVEHAPAVVPAWRDLVPGSAFLETTMGTPLPHDVRYYLFFGFGGGSGSRFVPGANDGVVTVAAELDPRAQIAARRMFGYDETHTGILNSAAVAAQLNAVLATP